MARDGRGGRGIKAARTAFDVVESLERLGGATVTELAEDLGLAKSTVHHHLTTLGEAELVVEEGGTYRLGLRFMELGRGVRDQQPLTGVAEPIVEDVAEESGELVWLIVEEHGRAVHLDRGMGENAFQIRSEVGTRSHLHCLAAGKALLAHLPRERVEAIVDRHGLPASTPHTITDREELFEELARIRERGYGFNENEEIVGVRGVGAPIVADGEAIGALGIGGPENRMRGDRFREEYPNLLLGATNEIELRLTYS